MTPYGLLDRSTDTLGLRPAVVPNFAFFVLVSCAIGAAAVWLAVMARAATVDSPETNAGTSLKNTGWLAGPFCVAYMVLLVYRTGLGFAFDRHLIVVLPFVYLTLLSLYQRTVSDRIPVVGWIVLCAMAAFGVATTHDYFATARARLAAATALTIRGIPRTAITAGFEYDAWTELEARGYLNNPRIRVPASVYRPRLNRVVPDTLYYWFWNYTPSIDPKYFVVHSRQAGLVDAPGAASIAYHTWLPPHSREVITQAAAPEIQRDVSRNR
jgi:hypothetical protein